MLLVLTAFPGWKTGPSGQPKPRSGPMSRVEVPDILAEGVFVSFSGCIYSHLGALCSWCGADLCDAEWFCTVA